MAAGLRSLLVWVAIFAALVAADVDPVVIKVSFKSLLTSNIVLTAT
jgi:hypothetical protein